MQIRHIAIYILFCLVFMTACRSLNNEGGRDWASVEFSIEGAKQSSVFSSASVSSTETALILAVPGNITSLSITNYLESDFDRELQNRVDNTVSLKIPLNVSIRLVKVVFNQVLTLDDIVDNQPTASYTGISEVFMVAGGEESKTIAIARFSSDMTSFSFKAEGNSALSADVEGGISGTNVSFSVPFGTDVTSLVATFTSTGHAVTVGAIVQISGITANDFTSSVTYTVTAVDGGTQGYVVTTAFDPMASDTGQTACYNNTVILSPCPSSGQAFYGQDANYTINPPVYTNNSDGVTVRGDNTGLTWQREDDDLYYQWAPAGTYCDDLVLSGQNDWRAPTRRELLGIVNYRYSSPAVDSTYFPNTNVDAYWPSSVMASNPAANAWLVDFSDGGVGMGAKTNTVLIRCVRQGPFSTDFTDNGDLTVTDNNTKLVWQQVDDNSTPNWETALSYCESLTLAGQSNWRLPNVRELESIVDETTFSPAINSTDFPTTDSDYYWSSTTYQDDFANAWTVFFDSGAAVVVPKTSSYYVRCVRGGQ
jgi:uncharacterized protein DUF1566